jgi:DNA-binding NtrC family response regulator
MATKHRILIADDEDSYRELLSMQFTRAGYEVHLAADGEEALTHLGKNKFDVVLLDIRMPKVGGIQVLKYISQNCPTTKSIVLTGFADLELAMEAKQFGAVDFINKPFSLDDVMTSVRQAIL